MKLRAIVLAVLLGFVGLTYASPLSTFSWTPPTNYENGQVLDTTVDPLTYNLYCSDTSGGPYSFVTTFNGGSSAAGVDVASCVQGVPGTYYFVLTAVSSVYNAESGYSNELAKTYTVSDLGLVPNAPVLLSIQ